MVRNDNAAVQKAEGLEKRKSPRQLSDLELVLTMLAEASTRDISQAEQPEGFAENQAVARRGGNVAGVARKALETETGKPVITSQNAADFARLVGEIVEDTVQLSERHEKTKDRIS